MTAISRLINDYVSERKNGVCAKEVGESDVTRGTELESQQWGVSPTTRRKPSGGLTLRSPELLDDPDRTIVLQGSSEREDQAEVPGR